MMLLTRENELMASGGEVILLLLKEVLIYFNSGERGGLSNPCVTVRSLDLITGEGNKLMESGRVVILLILKKVSSYL